MSLLKRIAAARSSAKKPEYEGREPEYWERRFAASGGALAAPGHSGLDEHANAANYNEKRAFFRRHLPRWAPPADNEGRPASLLDAGCGPGVLSGVWIELGYRVTGIDFSPSAVGLARDRHGDAAAFEVGQLEHAPGASGAPFDAAVCIDVLFHVVRTEAWRAALRGLTRAVGGGPLIIQETLDPSQRRSKHVRWRARDEYRIALAELGFVIHEHQVYRLDAEGVDKHVLVCRRAAATGHADG